MRRNRLGRVSDNSRSFPNLFFFCFCVFAFFALLVFCGCGLDTYYVLDQAPRRGNYPSDDSDYAQRYFEFWAAPNSNTGNSEFHFLGTYVYYRIYSNPSTMNSNHLSIEAVNNSSNYSAAAERMIGLGYKELYTSNGSRSPLVSESVGTAYVRIRLTNNDENGHGDIGHAAQIEIGGVNVGIPRRSRGQSYSFDFGRNGKAEYSGRGINYDLPISDEDFYGGSPSDGKYYVDMYAVAAGRDTTFARYYSNVTYLGSITINANEENN